MKVSRSGLAGKGGLAAALLVLLLPLLLAALACNFTPVAEDPGPIDETDVAHSVQTTIDAQQTSAAQVEQTVAAFPLTPPPQQDMPEPSATLAPSQEPTTAPTEVPPSATLPPPTATAAPTQSGPITLLDWKMVFWVQLNSGCKVAGTPCWRTNDNFNLHIGIAEVSLNGQDLVFIDPAWPRPFLVYWNRRNLNAPARLEIEADGNWIKARDINRDAPWMQEYVDLKAFVGQSIRVRFSVDGAWGSGVSGSDWYIQEVQIVPDFKQ